MALLLFLVNILVIFMQVFLDFLYDDAMKKILSFMDWGIFALRLYHYILLLSRVLAVSEFSNRTLLNVIWLSMALVAPLLFWFPGRRMNKVWFCILELLLGGSYYVNSVIHPDLTSKADYLLPSLTIGYLLTKQTLWVNSLTCFHSFYLSVLPKIILGANPGYRNRQSAVLLHRHVGKLRSQCV